MIKSLKYLAICAFLTCTNLYSAEPNQYFKVNSTDLKSYENYQQKHGKLLLVLNKCLTLDKDVQSEKIFRCLQNVNAEVSTANSLLYSNLDKYDRSGYTSGLDIGFNAAMKGCEQAYPSNLQKLYKNQILHCKLSLQLERVKFIAFRSLPYSN